MFGESLTAVQHRLQIKILVFNNAALSFVVVELKTAGFGNFGTGLENPDFGAGAQAVGVHGENVPRSRPRGLRRAFAGPARVSVPVKRQELSVPPIDAKQATVFAVYALRAVLACNRRELIDLTKANARQLL